VDGLNVTDIYRDQNLQTTFSYDAQALHPGFPGRRAAAADHSHAEVRRGAAFCQRSFDAAWRPGRQILLNARPVRAENGPAYLRTQGRTSSPARGSPRLNETVLLVFGIFWRRRAGWLGFPVKNRTNRFIWLACSRREVGGAPMISPLFLPQIRACARARCGLRWAGGSVGWACGRSAEPPSRWAVCANRLVHAEWMRCAPRWYCC